MIAKILISSSIKARQEATETLLSDFSIKKGHPDLLYLKQEEKLGIEQARDIKVFLSTKPFQADGKAVVLEDASQITAEAQNALLKTLEELPQSSLFIMGTASEDNFLPTVLSRCEVINLSGQPKDDNLDIKKLINSSLEEQFNYIEKCNDRDQLLKDIVNYFHQTLPSYSLREASLTGNMNFITELLEAAKWAASNGNIRAILEYLMLVMPS